ncbi:MAG: XdhC family protein [Mucilaginibacter polytrichastri]|nr:XdhC family protein [Mucilaginibacter polytrichastri]
MKEIRDIILAYNEATAAGKKTALATVVKVEGSSYRRPGARMLVTEDGHLTGAISGGCLEGDALQKARLTIQEGEKRVITYDTSDEDDTRSGVGLGCQGIIHILFEPIQPEDNNNPVQLLKCCSEKRQNAVLATFFNLENRRAAQRGTCFFFREQEAPFSAIAETRIADDLLSDAHAVLESGSSRIKTFFTGETAFIELIRPPVSLIIFGAGNDIAPLVHISSVLGWETSIIDGRSNYASADRFPGCSVFLSRPEDALDKIYIDTRTAVLLMTHNYVYDLAVLRQLAGKKPGYIGSLGPRKKLDLMLGELAGENIDHQKYSNLYGPTGLDIGAETPEEIALSIISEIQAVFNARNGASLRQKQTGIHEDGSLFDQRTFDEEA